MRTNIINKYTTNVRLQCGKNSRRKNDEESVQQYPRRKEVNCTDNDDAVNDLNKISVSGWRKIARETDSWKLILKEAKVLHRPHSQCSRRKVVTTLTGFTWMRFRSNKRGIL
jgi:hypothetical protein